MKMPKYETNTHILNARIPSLMLYHAYFLLNASSSSHLSEHPFSVIISWLLIISLLHSIPHILSPISQYQSLLWNTNIRKILFSLCSKPWLPISLLWSLSLIWERKLPAELRVLWNWEFLVSSCLAVCNPVGKVDHCILEKIRDFTICLGGLWLKSLSICSCQGNFLAFCSSFGMCVGVEISN